MSGVGNWFTGLFGSNTTELPNIFPLDLSSRTFVEVDVLNIYCRILIDVTERTTGLSNDQKKLLWDNCLASESQDGVITMLGKAMRDRSELFLVYDTATKVVRRAKDEETARIREDYKKQAQSSTGIYITFQNFSRSDLVKLYSALEYCNVGGLWKSMNLSKAVQLKMNELRSSVGLNDRAAAREQALAIATGLSQGKDILTDAKDVIETARPDLTAAQTAMAFIDQKRSFYLGMPASYINGIQKSTMGDTGEADAKAVERGLKGYYFSIVKPVLEALFDIQTSFKSEDYRSITTATAVLKDFEVTSEEYLSKENKQVIVNRVFGLEDNEQGDAVTEEKPVAETEKVALPPGKSAVG